MQAKTQVIKIVKIHIFEILGRAKPNTENVRGLNLAAAKHMTVKVAKNAVVIGASSNRA
jgi:hypothetical protein